MRYRVVCCAAAVALLNSLSSPVAGQDPVAEERSQQEPYVVGEALPPLDEGRVLRNMTLEDAVDRAIAVNLNIQSAQLSPAIQAYALDVAQAAFATTLSGSLGYNNSTNQSTSQLDGGSQINAERYTANGSLAKPLPWYGGRLALNFNNSRLATDNIFATRNPSYNSQVSLSFSQPLLAGLKTDPQRAAVKTQEIQAQITDLDLRARIENVVADVRESYWGLRAAIEQIEIQRRSRDQTAALVEQNRVRAQLGRGTQYEVVQAEAQLAAAEQALLNAEIQWRNQELAFKELILSGAGDALLMETINPTELPVLVDPEVDLDQALERALAVRTDLQAERERQRINEVNLEVTESSRLPELNLTAAYSLQGVGGDLFARSGLGGAPVLVQPGGYVDGLSSIVALDVPTWSVTLNGSLPLGLNAERANLERARLELRQQELALRAQELAVVTQVTGAALAVDNTFLQYEAAQRSREAAEENAAAEQVRFNVGAATNFELVTAQNQVTEARLSELQALIAHLNAVAEFDRVQRVGN
ncbi:MAG: TolC family protein [Gemmatimonadota bacterium]